MADSGAVAGEKDAHVETLEDLKARHRAELKDVRAQVQKLKAQGKSGDKKAKKDATAAAATLEKETELRHELELKKLTEELVRAQKLQQLEPYLDTNDISSIPGRGHCFVR
jgi:Skp family chaperone for outer membrane proteins